MARERFDIGVIIPLEDEIIPFFEIFETIEDRSDDEFLHHVINSGHSDVTAVVVQQHKMGRSAAEAATGMLLERYDLRLIACVGISGSLSGDMRLGDVCYSGELIDVLDNAKFSDAEDSADIELSPTHYETPTPIVTRMNYVRTQPSLKQVYAEWQEQRALVAKKLVPAEVPTPGGGMFHIGEPQSKSGAIACGAVSKSKVYNAKLRGIERAMLAIETESGGVFFRSKRAGTPVVTIRGISDYADKDKKNLEEVSRGGVRQLAAANAASFLRLQISSNMYFREGLLNRLPGQQAELALATTKATTDPVSASLDELTLAIDENLRKLSPEYKLQDKGYRLPLPRIREIVSVEELEPVDIRPEVDVREAIGTNDRLLINLPRTYPDQSLSWVMAD